MGVMKKLKTFFYVFKNSVISPKYYNDILKTNLWFSVKYYLMLSLFSSLLFAIFSTITTFSMLSSSVKTFSDDLKNIYPDELVIDFKGGKWEVNQPEPVFIPMPKIDFGADSKDTKISQNLIVLDKQGTINQFKDYDTLILMNEENIIYMDQGGIKAQPLKPATSSAGDITIDKSKVISGINEAYKYLWALPYILPIFIFIFVFIFLYIFAGFFNITLVGTVLLVFSLITGRKLDFSSTCKIGIHAMTVPIIIQLILSAFPTVENAIPGWFLLLSIGLGIYFTVKMGKKQI